LQKPEKQQKPGRFEIAEGLEKEKIRIDDKDRIILKMLSHDARVKIVDMAEKIALTPEAVLYRLRRLEKDKVILGSSMIFNTNKLGYYFADLLIEINPFSSEIQERIKKASRQNKRINHLLFLVNQPNCLIQIIFKTQEELEETIKEIKSLFQDEYAKVKILFPKIEEKINTLPFY
jgi:DNA-binding Lrp family transcriptional regulator